MSRRIRLYKSLHESEKSQDLLVSISQGNQTFQFTLDTGHCTLTYIQIQDLIRILQLALDEEYSRDKYGEVNCDGVLREIDD